MNWIKGEDHAPAGDRILWLDNGELRLPVPTIPSTLRAVTDVTKAVDLAVNKKPKVCFQGQTTGNVKGFRLTRQQAQAMARKDPGSAPYLRPMISGDPMLTTLGISQYVIDLPHTDVVEVNRVAPAAVAHLREHVLPVRELAAIEEQKNNADALASSPNFKVKKHHQNFLAKWWRHAYRRDDMLDALAELTRGRYIALVIVAAEDRMSIYNFVSTDVRPDASLQVFAFDDDYSFGILSSGLHRAWFDERCSKLKRDPRYTPTTVWNTFPWPANPSDGAVAAVAAATKAIIDLRQDYLEAGVTLAAMYDALRGPGQSKLRDLHDALDSAVIEAYGFNPDEDLLAQLLALNLVAAEDPELARRPGCHGLADAYTTTYRLTAAAL